ncbi:MAG: isocitrate/isopropylmalate dehydrogenase family protein, partial [Desulfofustis sp.]|nr:isocitrate/isopropylmalate dehydrogenase family protein [Desulfofustis sp.]
MKILVLPGDGIGPEITESTVAVLDAVNKRFGLGVEYVYEDIGFVSLDKYGTTLRGEVLELARTLDG